MDRIIVAKFGGSSLANAQGFKRAKNLVKIHNCKAVIISAMGVDNLNKVKITDQLNALFYLNENEKIKIINSICKRYSDLCKKLKVDFDYKSMLKQFKIQTLSSQNLHFVLSRGEFLSSYIFAKFLNLPFYDAKDIIKFNDEILDENSTISNIKQLKMPFITGGFYGSNQNGEVVTFSRGGSDLTASIVANALDADCLIKFTNTDGIFKLAGKISLNSKNSAAAKIKSADTCNKINYDDNSFKMKVKICNEKNIYTKLNYNQLKKLCKNDKNIMHPQSLDFLIEKNIPLKILNSFDYSSLGTTIIN